MLEPDVKAVAALLITVKPDLLERLVFTGAEVKALMPSSAGVTVAVLVIVPDALAPILPETEICIVLFGGKFPVKLKLFPLPVAPADIVAPPESIVLDQVTFPIVRGIASVITEFKLFDGPSFLTVIT